ncbi:MAG TPA: hypothetical protein VD772_08410, partial [Anseongella sp.]|nr:hypothetical protein [Anseongella sp.]
MKNIQSILLLSFSLAALNAGAQEHMHHSADTSGRGDTTVHEKQTEHSGEHHHGDGATQEKHAGHQMSHSFSENL